MKNYVSAALVLIPAIVSAQAIDRRDVKSVYAIEYGLVETVEKVSVKSDAAKGAVVGGVAGAVAGKHHRVRNAAIGAAAGALLTAIVEGSHKAYAYTVNLETGGAVKVIVDHGDIQPGDCVAVEQGNSANVRRVTADHCHESEHEALAHADVAEHRQEEAEECHIAKEAALDAETEEQLSLAMKKVNVFCQ